jgi:cholesterol oxidase
MQVTSSAGRIGRETALYDVRLGSDMHVLVGCGLGGGSLVNAGVSLRPDPRVFADAVWPGPIRQDGLLEAGFQRAEEWLRPMADPLAAEQTKFKALAAAGQSCGQSAIAPRVTVSFAEIINAAGVLQPACTRCGDCVGGCNVGAKNTVALTYLPDAVRHGAKIFTQAKVRHVAKRHDGSWDVHVVRLDGDVEGNVEFVLQAALVIVAAGTLGSTEIMLRSAARGLAVSGRVGHRFSANGDIIAFGYGAKRPVDAIGVGHPIKAGLSPVGASVTGQLEIRDVGRLDHELTVQEGVVPSALAPMLPMMFLPNGRIVGALQSLINGVYKGPFSSLQTFFAVSHDSASGAFSLDGDRLVLRWPGAKDEPVYQRLDAWLSELVGALGGSYVKNPMAGVMGHQPATAHPLGGLAMATTHADGVVNHKGQVFDAAAGRGETAVHDGLYVIDGSIIPRSLGVNPLLTISALAERAMLHLAADRGLTSGALLASGARQTIGPGAATTFNSM